VYVAYLSARIYVVGSGLLILKYLLGTWKYSFAAMLLAAFVKVQYSGIEEIQETGENGMKNAAMKAAFVKIWEQSAGLLAGLLVEVICLTLLAFVPVAVTNHFYWEYLVVCMKRICYYFGILGFAALAVGMLLGSIRKNHAGYAVVFLTAVFVNGMLEGYVQYNINPYDPCPTGQILVRKKGNSYSIDGMLSGLTPQESCEELKNTFAVEEYHLELWINQKELFYGKADVAVEQAQEQYDFSLSPYMTVETVTDEDGNELAWEHNGTVLSVFSKDMQKGGNTHIKITYGCGDESVLAIRSEYISFPAYSLYYPQASSDELLYQVTVHTQGRVYTNLETVGENCFAGRAASLSLLGGVLIGETYYGEVRIIYPKLGFSEDQIIKRYQANCATRPDTFREEKDWFADSFASLAYQKYYDDSKMSEQDYIFCFY
jgi:hypothetical protein